ncbi:MAG: hypothetical protein ACUVWA_06110 [Candidatus Oleimicrobiaceae bacterium]
MRIVLDKGAQIKLRLPDRVLPWVSSRFCCLRGGPYSCDRSGRDDGRVADQLPVLVADSRLSIRCAGSDEVPPFAQTLLPVVHGLTDVRYTRYQAARLISLAFVAENS